MKILLLSSSPIKREISIGNTFLNLFEDMDEIELASIYTREGKPDSRVQHSLCITEKTLLKNLIKGTSVIQAEEKGNQESSDSTSKSELSHRKHLMSLVKRSRLTIFFMGQNLIWRIGRWETGGFDQFVREYNPDVIFTVLSDSEFLNRMILRASSITKSKLILYAWDNNYSMKMVTFSPLKWMQHIYNRVYMRKVARRADIFYVISDVQKDDYEKAFKKPCKVLTKFHNFTEPIILPSNIAKPVQLVFTGNIGLNRWKSLRMIAEALREINKEKTQAELRIYSSTEITAKMKKGLDIPGCSYLMGAVPANRVSEIQKNADILVHVEAFDLKNKLLVRQSFSTKIVDYFKMARPILAVGPKEVASIAHLVKHDCAITASSKKELIQKLQAVLNDETLLEDYARRGYACGLECHNAETLQNMLREDLSDICRMEG